jgi:hypothetical protein
MARDYKDEYEKFQKDKSAYRAKLNKYNRDKGTYGNGDGLDASHGGGGIVGFESSSKNKGKKEKSRLKGSKRKLQDGGKLHGPSHEEGGIPAKVKGSDKKLELEGGEIIMNTNKNNAADIHEEDLLALNDNPQDYEILHKDELQMARAGGLIDKSSLDTIDYINKHGDLQMTDARKRRNK